MQDLRNFEDAARAVIAHSQPASKRGQTYSLDTMRQFMCYLGDPQEKIQIIHVAGTSGKTSTAYYIAALLKHSGHTVGLSVSPHVDTINERAQVNLAGLPEAEYCQELTKFLELVRASTCQLTYFELLIAFAYWLFAKRQLDYAVIEVGLGGLLDSTNVIQNPNKIAVITDIGLDHTEILGTTLQSIAAQKAGIIMPGNQVFIQPQPAPIMNVMRSAAERQDATLHAVNAATNSPNLPLFQQRNLNLALAVATHILNQQPNATVIAKAAQTYIPARMEIIHFKDKTVILDGSHNAQKIAALVQSIKAVYPQDSLGLLVSFGSQKRPDISDSLRELHTLGDDITVTAFSSNLSGGTHHAIPVSELSALCQAAGFGSINSEQHPEAAFAHALNQKPILLVTGSYFLLNHIRPLVGSALT